MWAPTLNTPEQDSLLWVFEGLTEYWSDVLQARAELTTKQETLNGLASTAGLLSIENGAQWRSLTDVSQSPVFAFRKVSSWPTWQRDMFDAYGQGELIWLGVDTRIRKQTQGKRSLDDFAKSFFGSDNGRVESMTYTFEEMVQALNKISPYDWSTYLRERLNEHGTDKSLEGLREAGYTLAFRDKVTPADQAKSYLDLTFSIGLQVATGGRIAAVHWSGAAFQAGIIPGGTIKQVNGQNYDSVLLEQAVQKGGTILLNVARSGVEETDVVQWNGGLRQPELQRTEGTTDILGDILAKNVGFRHHPKPLMRSI